MRRSLTWLAWWIGLTALWVALAAKTTLPFVVMAAATAMITAAAMAGLQRLGLGRGESRIGWVRHFGHLPGQIFSDCAVLAGALWRQLARREAPRGAYREIAFDPGDEDDPEAMARRALVTWGISLPPNSYMVWVDPHRQCVLVHELVPTPDSSGHGDRKWPV